LLLASASTFGFEGFFGLAGFAVFGATSGFVLFSESDMG
jgi:hypothetical protein